MIPTIIAAGLFFLAWFSNRITTYEVQREIDGAWQTIHRCDSGTISRKVMANFKTVVPFGEFRSVPIYH